MGIIAVTEFGVLDRPLLNIRMTLDELSVRLHLVPELVLLDQTGDPEESNEALREILSDARPIVEADTCLQLDFESVLALALDADIDVDLFGDLLKGGSNAPMLQNSAYAYPFLEITDSLWKKQLPDWRGRNDPEIRHFRMMSSDCNIDILARSPVGKWVPNEASEL